MKSVLSVDVAKGKSMMMLMTEYGEILIDAKEIKHNLKEFNCLRDEIQKFNLKDLTVFMESTSIYHLPIERYFKANNYKTLVINSARWILFNCSEVMVKVGATWYPNHPIYIYYQKKKAEGKHYYECLTACSTKFLRMLYSMCKNNKTFLIK